MQQMLLQKRNDLFFIEIRLKQEGLTSCFQNLPRQKNTFTRSSGLP